MKSEAGPRRRHSPFSEPGRSPEPLLESDVAVAAAVAAAVSTAERAVGGTAVGIGSREAVDSIVENATSVGRARRGDSVEEACWSSDIKDCRLRSRPTTGLCSYQSLSAPDSRDINSKLHNTDMIAQQSGSEGGNDVVEVELAGDQRAIGCIRKIVTVISRDAVTSNLSML